MNSMSLGGSSMQSVTQGPSSGLGEGLGGINTALGGSGSGIANLAGIGSSGKTTSYGSTGLASGIGPASATGITNSGSGAPSMPQWAGMATSGAAHPNNSAGG